MMLLKTIDNIMSDPKVTTTKRRIFKIMDAWNSTFSLCVRCADTPSEKAYYDTFHNMLTSTILYYFDMEDDMMLYIKTLIYQMIKSNEKMIEEGRE